MTSIRAARAAGSHDATTAAVSSTNAERTTGKAPGIFTSRKTQDAIGIKMFAASLLKAS
jgi:hypothetical protein